MALGQADIKKLPKHKSYAYNSENRYKLNNYTMYIQTKPLTARWVAGFNAAKKAIEYSDINSPGHYMGAAIYEGNRLLSFGNNFALKTKPGNTAVKRDGTTYDITCHAEQIAIDRIKYKKGNSIRLIMYVVRINAKGRFVASRPCAMCIDYMKTYGIKIVRFINLSGVPEEMKIM